MINWLNSNVDAQLSIIDVDTSSIDSNGWFSGFIDADGCFSVNARDGGAGRVEASLRLEQRQTNPITGVSYYDVLSSIAALFLGTLNNKVQHGTGRVYYLIRFSSFGSFGKLVSYFDQYPLFTSKYLDCCDFSFCVNLMLKGEHLSTESKKVIWPPPGGHMGLAPHISPQSWYES